MSRPRPQLGDWLVVDDESGLTILASESVKLWDGRLVHHDQYEERNPQEFVRAGRDPHPLPFARPDIAPDVAYPFNVESMFVGDSNVPTPISPASHLYSRIGIGEMVVSTQRKIFRVS